MLFVRRADGAADYSVVGAAILAVMVVVWLTLRCCGLLVRILLPGGV
jgi:multiple antibiotic resistance protein